MSETIVIKIGGVASQQLGLDFLEEIKNWKEAGHRIVIVHGGGFAISKLMGQYQIPVERINGLRVTHQSEMPLVHYALVEQVGLDITTRMQDTGLDALQLKSSLTKVVKADFLDKSVYGYVGQVHQIHTGFLETVLQEGFIPILASLGYSAEGEELNINADYLATAVASALAADKLILMTDVKGVLENGQMISVLDLKDIPSKIDQGIITGGMIPKIESAAKTVLAGVRQVVIGDRLSSGTIIEESL